MYKQFKTPTGELILTAILKVDNNTYIPFDPDNTDYQAYLKWLEEGNVPTPADEGVTP
jgi:hypothetical protein